jgi:hypothetical protein
MMAALMLSGCAHKSLVQEKTDEFIGRPLSAVTAKLGTPTEEGEAGGTKMHTWSGAAGPESTQEKCTIRVTMNGDVIGSLDSEGTESQCANYALMLKGPDCRSLRVACVRGNESMAHAPGDRREHEIRLATRPNLQSSR